MESPKIESPERLAEMLADVMPTSRSLAKQMIANAIVIRDEQKQKALDAKVKEANELIVRYQETIQRLQSELDNSKVVIEEQAFELGRLRNRVTVMGIGSLRHREVMGDECAIEGCPYERDGDSQYCADHKSSASAS